MSVAEKYNSRRQVRGQQPIQEVGYLMVGYGDENEAIDAMLGFAPASWDIGGITLPPFNPEAHEIGPEIWEGKMTYGFGSIEQTISFDTSGGKAKVTQSLNTQSYPADGVEAPDFRGAIGVTKSGVEGAEVTEPALAFTIKKTFDAAAVTLDYVKTLSDLTGSYNNSGFMGFAEGEIRFDGAQGDQKQIGQPVDISFKFTRSQNVTALTVAGITGIDKLGWQYLWVLYEEQEDETAHFMVQRAISVYVEDLPGCQPADFSALGLGT
jgi:hypothetical protein